MYSTCNEFESISGVGKMLKITIFEHSNHLLDPDLSSLLKNWKKNFSQWWTEQLPIDSIKTTKKHVSLQIPI